MVMAGPAPSPLASALCRCNMDHLRKISVHGFGAHHRPCLSAASRKASRSPSSTFCVADISTWVRRSLMRLLSRTYLRIWGPQPTSVLLSSSFCCSCWRKRRSCSYRRERRRCQAMSRLPCWLRPSWHCTRMPVGRCVRRTAEAGVGPAGGVERALAHRAVHTGFGAQQAIGVFALDLDRGALEAGHIARCFFFDRGLEALALGVPQ